jgi:glycosyltransferase involved in cell wall biosynthesis
LQFGLPAGGLLRRSWTQHRPDVVYVATEGPLGWSAVRIARRLGIPVFSGFHTNFHSYSKYYRAGRLRHLIVRYLCRFHNRTLGTLVPSVDLRDRLQALGFKNISVLGRGVDSQLFTPERRCTELRHHWGASDHELVVLYVGRIASEKNLGLAVDAYRAMQRFSVSVKFVIVGDGPLCATMQKEHADLIFCGARTGKQLARHYASADVFLFPSETETFGNVTLEAMASGLVVVAYDYAAAQMHITPGETGVLVPYGESKAFIDSAARLICEPQSLDKMRRQAREYVAALSWQCVVERFETLLMGARSQSCTVSNSSLTRRSLVAEP